MGGGRRQAGLAGDLAKLDGALVDGAVGQHDDQQAEPVGEPHQLDGADPGRVVGGGHDHRRVVGQARQQLGGVLQHLLELAVSVREELRDALAPGGVQPSRRPQGVDEEAVALVGGNAAGRGVGLGQVALPLERRHVVAHGGGGDGDVGGLGDAMRAHRLRRLDVLADDRSKDGCLPFVEAGPDVDVATDHVASLRCRRRPLSARGSALALESTEC